MIVAGNGNGSRLNFGCEPHNISEKLVLWISPYMIVKLSCILVFVCDHRFAHNTHTAIVFIIIAIAFYIFQYDSLPAHDLLMVVLSNAIACFVFNELPTASTPFKWLLLPKQFPWDHFNRFTSFLEYNDNLSHFLLFQPKVCFFNLRGGYVFHLR